MMIVFAIALAWMALLAHRSDILANIAGQ
jgi:hypothetical protein